MINLYDRPMHIPPSSLALAFILSLVAAPTADALMWSSFTAATTKYDVRAAIKAKRSAPKKRAASVELPIIAKGGLVFGDVEATTTIVMFTDIQCPFCKRFTNDTYPSLKKDYVDTGKVRFVVRHFPLAFHPNAAPAARAVVCARQQSDDKARSLYTKFFALKELTEKGINSAIGAVEGLDAAKVKECMVSDAAQKVVDTDYAAGTEVGVSGTPNFFIVGPSGTQKQISGAYPLETFVKAIEEVQKK